MFLLSPKAVPLELQAAAFLCNPQESFVAGQVRMVMDAADAPMLNILADGHQSISTWWLIPLSKWVITPVINGISRVDPLIIGVITHLLSGMSHQVVDGFSKP